MKVKCVDNEQAKDQLTIGKVYETLHSLTKDNLFPIRIVDDNGKVTDWFTSRFEEMDPATKQTRFKL